MSFDVFCNESVFEVFKLFEISVCSVTVLGGEVFNLGFLSPGHGRVLLGP